MMCELNLPENWKSLSLMQQLDWFDAVHATVRHVPQKVERPMVIHLPHETENSLQSIAENV